MDPQSAAALFAMLVGLICNWKQERGATKADRANDFMLWLESHNFNELRARIDNSAELQRELNALLREDAVQLSEKLDLICRTVARISERIEGFGALTRALDVREELSEQATHLLKHFVSSKATGMLHFGRRDAVVFVPAGQPVGGVLLNLDRRFLSDDIRTLAELGLITLSRHNPDGEPIYTLTRAGARFAEQLEGSAQA